MDQLIDEINEDNNEIDEGKFSVIEKDISKAQALKN